MAEQQVVEPVAVAAAPQEEEALEQRAPSKPRQAENGHAEQNGGKTDGGAEPPQPKRRAGAGAGNEERKKLWFVRVPKPPEVPEVKACETELQAYRLQLAALNDQLSLKKLERDAAREQTRGAREAFNECRRVYDERRSAVGELRKLADEAGGEVTKLKESFRDLEVRTEAELDELLAKLQFRLQHESIPLTEEKKIMAQLKRLEGQRERVRGCEASGGLLDENKQKRKELLDQWREHDTEIKLLQEEKNMQHAILEKYREQEGALDAEVDDLMSERWRLKEQQEKVHARATELRAAQKAKNDEYYDNRRFSRRIREVLAEGRLEEARQLCAEQVDTALARLASDAACRAEYFKLWEVQRKAPVVLPSAAVDDADEPAASAEEARAGAAKGGLGRGNKAAAAAAEEAAEAPVEPAKKAEAVIAAVLEEAQEELRRSKAAADAAAAAQAAAEAAAAHAATAAVPVAVRESVEGAAAEAKPRARPPRAPKHSAPAVEPVVLPEDNFELPEAVRLKGKTPSADELKALEREHNARAFADAERRKQRRSKEKERKRARALAEAAARVAAGLPPAAAASAAADSSAGEESAGEAEVAAPGSDDGAGAGEVAHSSTSGGAGAAAGASRVYAKNLPAPLKVMKAMESKPSAKRPKEPRSRELTRFLRKHFGAMLLVIAFVLLVTLLLPFFTPSPQLGKVGTAST